MNKELECSYNTITYDGFKRWNGNVDRVVSYLIEHTQVVRTQLELYSLLTKHESY